MISGIHRSKPIASFLVMMMVFFLSRGERRIGGRYFTWAVIAAVVLSLLYFKERIKPLGYLGILVGLAGMVLLAVG